MFSFTKLDTFAGRFTPDAEYESDEKIGANVETSLFL